MSAEPARDERPAQVADLPQLARALREEGVEILELGMAHTIAIVTVFGAAAPLYIRWSKDEPMVLLSQLLPVVFPPQRSADLAMALLRINRSVDLAGFLGDPVRGEVVMRTHLFPDRQGNVEYPLLLNVLITCVLIAYNNLPTLRAAVLGQAASEAAETTASLQVGGRPVELLASSTLREVLKGFAE